MPKVLVGTHRHELIPLHHRLIKEGWDSEVLVWNRRYERAWDGKVTKIIKRTDGTLNQEALEPVVEAATLGEVVVLTDIHRLAESFSGAQHLFPRLDGLGLPEPKDRVLFGGWFNGEEVQAAHLLVPDWGAWPSGLGPAVMGGLTLVRLSPSTLERAEGLVGGALHTATQALKVRGFKGLFQFDVEEDAEVGGFALRGLVAGWPHLHTEAFVAELASFGDVLSGSEPQLTRRFVTVLPITVPPWPNPRQGPGTQHPVVGLTPQQRARTYWYDVIVDTEKREIRTAGLDGLVGIATGASDATPLTSRARALEVAHRVQLPELQFRPDVGSSVESALSTLETRWALDVF